MGDPVSKKGQVYGTVTTDLKAAGKRPLEWDLNDWKWDGDLLVASSLNPVPSDCRSRQVVPAQAVIPPNSAASISSSSCSDETVLADENGRRELEKRRRAVVVPDEQMEDELGLLNLKLGGQSYPIVDEEADKWEERSGKKSKVVGNPSNRSICQVEDCGADLSSAKDYHRRHKVCEMHSKATQAIVGNIMQRFCQQCSRFHALQEFDEGKRSCRRRLAGHNRRRRKTHPETAVNVSSLNNEQSSNYLLISLLRLLSNLHSNNSDQAKDQDLLSHLLKNIAYLASAINGSNISGLAQGSQALLNGGTLTVPPEKASTRADHQHGTVPSNEAQKGLYISDSPSEVQQSPSAIQPGVPATSNPVPAKESLQEATVKISELNNIDLNNVYNDAQGCLDNQETDHTPTGIPAWIQKESLKSSPPQRSRNWESTSGHSLSSSSGSESQSCTDRIVFKLFGKDPSDLPHFLRTQILDWLSHSPTDIEGYIKPGCVVLTIYLRLNKSSWEELGFQLSSSLCRLLDMSNDSFWRTGWICTRIQHRMAFVWDGRVVLDTPLPSRSYKDCQISSIRPIAVSASKSVQFVVRGNNLSQSTSRLLCALEGKYLIQEVCSELVESDDSSHGHDEIHCLRFTCSIPDIYGRGFIEVEDYGLSGSFFPFIVSDPDVCSEICTLERIIEINESSCNLQGESEKLSAKIQALEFIHELGWLLHRSQLRFRLHQGSRFSFERLKCLIEFSMDHHWCAVVKKLLDLTFDGTVDTGDYPSVEQALSDMGLLHDAVRRNGKPMVNFLLTYTPETFSNKLGCEDQLSDSGESRIFFFRPDAVGPGGLTPLHVAAASKGFEDVFDALLEDPGNVGVLAWKTAKDSTGLTPYDYASLRGHYSYINLVEAKTASSSTGHVVLDIPLAISNPKDKQMKPTGDTELAHIPSFRTEKFTKVLPRKLPCNLCERRNLDCRYTGSAFTFRPAMLSMVAIAAVCVCVALLFKSCPEVYVFKPFRWESLKYGTM